MAIFSRRILQQIINENGSFLSEDQIKQQVDRLNAMHGTLKLDEWEVVLLNAFAKLGKVVHEDGKIAGTCDLYFESRDEPANNFLADITTISDEGFKKFGDFEGLNGELRRRVEAGGLNPDHFRLDVGGNHQEIQRGRYYWNVNANKLSYGLAEKAKLYTGNREEWDEDIFDVNWERFLDQVTRSRDPRTYRPFRVRELDVTISFAIGQGGGGSHLAHEQINDLIRNTMFYALKKKADQLAKAGFAGHRGIILCDGGYGPFHSGDHFATHSVKEVIERFLNDNPSISFVTTLVISRDSYPKVVNEIISHFYVSATIDRTIESMEKAIDLLPQPESDAFNAINHLKVSPHEGRKNGELRMSMNEIRISSRTLMELLSGRMTHEDFMSRYENMREVPGYANFFDMKLKEGMMISDLHVEPSKTRDDDVIVIKWNGPDPAISPFIAPTATKP